MFKKSLLAFALAATSFTSLADWTGGVSYVNISSDSDSGDLNLGALAASVGYEIESSENFSWIPELRIGLGVKEDSVSRFSGTDIEVERMLSFSFKGQYQVNRGLYVHLAPIYTNLEVKAAGHGYSVSDDEWELGFGGGFGFKFTKSTAVEFTLENYDGTKFISAGIKGYY